MRRSVLFAILLGACAGSQPEYFRPTERALGTTRAGDVLAIYDIITQAGRMGEAKVWSEGAHRGRLGGERRTLLRVGLELENLSGQPIAVDWRDLRLEAVERDHRLLPAIPLVAVAGEAVAAPGGQARLVATFVLPRGWKPQSVDAFRLRWAVTSGGQRYAQVTPFEEDWSREAYTAPVGPYAYPYVWYDPFYDPFFPERVVWVRRHPRRY